MAPTVAGPINTRMSPPRRRLGATSRNATFLTDCWVDGIAVPLERGEPVGSHTAAPASRAAPRPLQARFSTWPPAGRSTMDNHARTVHDLGLAVALLPDGAAGLGAAGRRARGTHDQPA